MAQVRPRLEAFAAEMLGGLARSDQRAKGELYLRGLLVDGKRKSMQPMAARLGVDHQQLQQFVTSSTWDYVEVRRRVARWADGFVGPEAYVIDDTGFPKDGIGFAVRGAAVFRHAGQDRELPDRGERARGDRRGVGGDRLAAVLPGVLGRYQRGGRDTASADPPPPDARAIPDEVRHREKWRLALDMLDEITGDQAGGGWGLPQRPVVADAGYGDNTTFRLGLEARGLPYVVAVRAPPAPTRAPPRRRSRPITAAAARRSPATAGAAATCEDQVVTAGRRPGRPVTWRQGTRRTPRNPTAAMRSGSSRCGSAPPTATSPAPPTAACPNACCPAEWPPADAEPTDYWLSNLPADTRLRDLVRLAKIRWRSSTITAS